MLETNVTIPPAQLAELQQRLAGIRNGVPIAVQAAISRTITTGRALIARRIGEEVNLRIGTIKGTIKAERGSMRKLEGRLSVVKDKAVWLIDYMSAAKRLGLLAKFLNGNRQPPLAVKVRKRKDVPKYPVNIAKAFVGVMPTSSYIGVFQRTGTKRPMKSGRYKGEKREVIRRMRGPSPYSVFVNAAGDDAPTILAEVVGNLRATFEKNLASQIQRVLAQKGMTGGRLANLGE